MFEGPRRKFKTKGENGGEKLNTRKSEAYGLKFPREFALLMKQLLSFDRYTRLLAPNLNMLKDDRIAIGSNRKEYGGGLIGFTLPHT